jgi:hypothetical protein
MQRYEDARATFAERVVDEWVVDCRWSWLYRNWEIKAWSAKIINDIRDRCRVISNDPTLELRFVQHDEGVWIIREDKIKPAIAT